MDSKTRRRFPFHASSAAAALHAQVPGVIKRSIELDFLRGIAILLVMCAHFSFPTTGFGFIDWPSQTLQSTGGTGVNLFFTLSGFLVGGLLLKEYKRTNAIEPWRFLARRAFKIWPPFYCLIIFHAFIAHHDRSTFLWQNILQVQNYFGSSIKQTWSLAVEEHFYLFLAALLAFLIGRTPRVIIVVLGLLCVTVITARIVAVHDGFLDDAFRRTHLRIDSLLYGVILAAIYVFYPETFRKFAAHKTMLVASAVLLCVFMVLTVNSPVIDRDLGYTVQGIGFALLVVLVYTGSGSAVTRLWYRAIARIGVYSYGIYLWHTIALDPGRKLLEHLSSWGVPSVASWITVVGAQLAIALILGIIMTRLVEWPALAIRERYFGADRNQLGAELPEAGPSVA
jgi:peptidoglycan/LPS O-acetylase OafA/YrhL